MTPEKIFELNKSLKQSELAGIKNLAKSISKTKGIKVVGSSVMTGLDMMLVVSDEVESELRELSREADPSEEHF
jgi:hypothetical protein